MTYQLVVEVLQEEVVVVVVVAQAYHLSLLVFRPLGRTQDAGCWCHFYFLVMLANFLFSDNAHGRIFDINLPGSQTNTIESCIAACDAQNYTVAGTEFSVCYFFTSFRP